MTFDPDQPRDTRGLRGPVPFHVVRLAHNGEFLSYAIYVNNVPFLVPPWCARGNDGNERPVLGKREAYAITRLLNQGPWTS